MYLDNPLSLWSTIRLKRGRITAGNDSKTRVSAQIHAVV